MQAGRVGPLNRDPHAGLFRVGQSPGGLERAAGQHGGIRTVDLGIADPVTDQGAAGQTGDSGAVDHVVQEDVLGTIGFLVAGVLGAGVLVAGVLGVGNISGPGDVLGAVDFIGSRRAGAHRGRHQRHKGTERHPASHASHGCREYA